MTKEEVVKLGIKSQIAQDIFRIHCEMNTQADPEKRAEQTRAYEIARADMHEAMNRHHRALQLLGVGL